MGFTFMRIATTKEASVARPRLLDGCEPHVVVHHNGKRAMRYLSEHGRHLATGGRLAVRVQAV
jgi:hypothetical protein